MQDSKNPLGRSIRQMRRLSFIVNVFAKHGFWSLIEKIHINRWLTPEQIKEAESMRAMASQEKSLKSPVASRLRMSFEELGPAFVKLGQILAVREDLLASPYIEEFRKLHQDVMEVPFKAIQITLDQELGTEKLAEFTSIDPKPLAAGSVAQVHSAKLKNGKEVVLKVQRLNIEPLIQSDLALMEFAAGLVEKYLPEMKMFRPVLTIQELKRAFLGELDFIREGGNTSKIAKNFENNSEIHIPEVYWQFTTQKVLTLEKLEGIPAWNRAAIEESGMSAKELVEKGLAMFLQMVFVDGEFHGDLHPGNLFALSEERIGILDFGLTVRLSKKTREHLAGLLISIVSSDFESVCRHFVELSEPGIDFDINDFERDIVNAVAPFLGLSLKQVKSGRMLWDLAKIAAKHGAPMPQELVLFVKTLVTFEGIGHHLDPEFDVMASCEKYASIILKSMYSKEALSDQAFVIAKDLGNLARHAPHQIRMLLKAATRGELAWQVRSEDLGKVAQSLDRSSSRIAVSIIIAALIIGSSILAYARIGDQYFNMSFFGLVGFSIAGFLGIFVIISILKGTKI